MTVDANFTVADSETAQRKLNPNPDLNLDLHIRQAVTKTIKDADSLIFVHRELIAETVPDNVYGFMNEWALETCLNPAMKIKFLREI